MNMDNCYPYPTEFPSHEISNVLGYFKGQGTDAACAAHCSWVIAGYGMNKLGPECSMAKLKSECSFTCSDEQAIATLEDCLAMHSDEKGLDWKSILKVILPLILNWLV